MTPVCPEPGTSACQAIRICRSEWVAWRESAGYQASGWTFCHVPVAARSRGLSCPVAADGGAESLLPAAVGMRGERLLKNGKVRAIGVSNFMVEHLANLLDEAEVVPAVNQIELHPYFQQPEVQALRRARHRDPGLVTDRRHHLLPRGRAHQHPGRPGHRQDRQVPLRESRAGHAALAPAGGTFGHPEVNQAPPHRGELRRVRLRAHHRRGRGHRRARYRQARRPRAGRHHPGSFGRQIPEA